RLSGLPNTGRARARKSPKGESFSEKGKSGTDVSPEPKVCQQIFWTLFSTPAQICVRLKRASSPPITWSSSSHLPADSVYSREHTGGPIRRGPSSCVKAAEY